MRVGIEASTCQDCLGRTHYRIAPFFRGTHKERHRIRLVFLALFCIFAMSIISAIGGDDPEIRPEVNLTPWYDNHHHNQR